MTIHHINLATAGSVGPSSHHLHSHVFRDARHLTTFALPQRDHSPQQNQRDADPLGNQRADAGLLDNQHPWVDDSAAQCPWDPKMPKGSRDAGLSGSRRPQIDDSTRSCHQDPEMLKSSWDAGLSGLHRHPRIDDLLEPIHPTRTSMVQDNSGIKRHLFDPLYARQLTLAMRLLTSTFNDYLQAAGLPRTFSFGRSSHHDMEFSELVYRQWATCLILKSCERRVLARILIAREAIRSFINKSELKPQEEPPCLTSPAFLIDSMLSKEVQKMTTPDPVPSQGGSPLAEDLRWAQQICQEKDSAISIIVAASTQKLNQDANSREPAREPAESPTELPEQQWKRNSTRDTTAGVAELEVTKPHPMWPISLMQDFHNERNEPRGTSSTLNPRSSSHRTNNPSLLPTHARLISHLAKPNNTPDPPAHPDGELRMCQGTAEELHSQNAFPSWRLENLTQQLDTANMQMSPRLANDAGDRISPTRPSTPEPISCSAEIHQEVNNSHSFQHGDSVRWNFLRSPSLQNGSTTWAHRNKESTQAHQPTRPHDSQHQRTEREALHPQVPTSFQVKPDAAITSSGHPVTLSHSSKSARRNLARWQDGRIMSTHQDEESRRHQEDTMTPGDSQEMDRPNAQHSHPPTEDSTQLHCRDPETLKGSRTADSRCRHSEDSTRPRCQGSLLLQGTRTADVGSTYSQSKDQLSRLRHCSDLFQGASRRQRLWRVQQCFQDRPAANTLDSQHLMAKDKQRVEPLSYSPHAYSDKFRQNSTVTSRPSRPATSSYPSPLLSPHSVNHTNSHTDGPSITPTAEIQLALPDSQWVVKVLQLPLLYKRSNSEPQIVASPPEYPLPMISDFHRAVIASRPYEYSDAARRNISNLPSLLNGSMTLAHQVEESARSRQRDTETCECFGEDNRSGSRCQQKDDSIQIGGQEFASPQEIQDSGVPSNKLPRDHSYDLAHAKGTHQNETQLPKGSQNANLSGARGLQVDGSTTPYSGNVKPAVSIHSDTVPRKTLKLQLGYPQHRRTEASLPQPSATSQALHKLAITSSNRLSNVRLPEGRVALPKPAYDTKRTEFLLGANTTVATSRRDDRFPATTAKGQLARLNSLLMDVHQAAIVSHSYKRGDSAQYNFSRSPSLQNGAPTSECQEESARSHQEDTLTPGGSCEIDRLGPQHPRTEDSMRSHYRDSETPRGSRITSPHRPRIKDTTRPHYQDSTRLQGTRNDGAPSNRPPRADSNNLAETGTTRTRTEDESLPKLPRRSSLFRCATLRQRLVLLQLGLQDQEQFPTIDASDSRLPAVENELDLDDINTKPNSLFVNLASLPSGPGDLGIKRLSYSPHGDWVSQVSTLTSRSLCPVRLPESTLSSLACDKRTSSHPILRPSPQPANLAKSYFKTDGFSRITEAKIQLAPPSAYLVTKALHPYKPSYSERLRLAHWPGPPRDRMTLALQDEEWLICQLVTKAPKDFQEANRRTEDSTQSHYWDTALLQDARNAGSSDNEHQRVDGNSIAYSSLTYIQPDDKSLLKPRLSNPLHRRTKASFSRPRLTSPSDDLSDSIIPAAKAKGQQDWLYPPLTSACRVTKATHPQEHEEPARSHWEDALTRGDLRENDRLGSRIPQTDDSKRSHGRDSETPKGSRKASSHRLQIEDSARPHDQDSALPQGTRNDGAPSNRQRRADLYDLANAGSTHARPEDEFLSKLPCNSNEYPCTLQRCRTMTSPNSKVGENTRYCERKKELMPKLSRQSNVSRSATQHRHLLMAQQCLQDLRHSRIINTSDSRLPMAENESGFEQPKRSQYSYSARPNPACGKMASSYSKPQPPTRPANLAEGYTHPGGSSLCTTTEFHLARPDACLGKPRDSGLPIFGCLPGPPYNRTTLARQEEWPMRQLFTRTPKDTLDANTSGSRSLPTEEFTQHRYPDITQLQDAQNIYLRSREHQCVEANSIVYSRLACTQLDNKASLKSHDNSSSCTQQQLGTRSCQGPKVENDMQCLRRRDEIILELRHKLPCKATLGLHDRWHLRTLEFQHLTSKGVLRLEHELFAPRCAKEDNQTKGMVHSNECQDAGSSHGSIAALCQPDAIRSRDSPYAHSAPDGTSSPRLLTTNYHFTAYVHSSSKVTKVLHTDDAQQPTASPIASATRLLVQESATSIAAQLNYLHSSIEDDSGVFLDPKGFCVRPGTAPPNPTNSANSTTTPEDAQTSTAGVPQDSLLTTRLLNLACTTATAHIIPVTPVMAQLSGHTASIEDVNLAAAFVSTKADLATCADPAHLQDSSRSIPCPPLEVGATISASSPGSLDCNLEPSSPLLVPASMLATSRSLCASQPTRALANHGATPQHGPDTSIEDCSDSHRATNVFRSPICSNAARRGTTSSPSLQNGMTTFAHQDKELQLHSTGENGSRIERLSGAQGRSKREERRPTDPDKTKPTRAIHFNVTTRCHSNARGMDMCILGSKTSSLQHSTAGANGAPLDSKSHPNRRGNSAQQDSTGSPSLQDGKMSPVLQEEECIPRKSLPTTRLRNLVCSNHNYSTAEASVNPPERDGMTTCGIHTAGVNSDNMITHAASDSKSATDVHLRGSKTLKLQSTKARDSARDSIVGLDKQIEELVGTIVLPMKQAKTGKTSWAHARTQTDAYHLKLAGPSVEQMFIGNCAELVHDPFDLTEEKALAITFIDDWEAIGTQHLIPDKSGDYMVQDTGASNGRATTAYQDKEPHLWQATTISTSKHDSSFTIGVWWFKLTTDPLCLAKVPPNDTSTLLFWCLAKSSITICLALDARLKNRKTRHEICNWETPVPHCTVLNPALSSSFLVLSYNSTAISLPPTMLFIALPRSANLGCPMTALSCNKENQHKKAKLLSGASGPQTQLRRRKCAHALQPAPPSSHAVAPGVAVAHGPRHHLVQQGHKQHDHPNVTTPCHSPPSNSEPEPVSIEPTAEAKAEASSHQQHQQRHQEQAIKPAVSGLEYNFPCFLPRYPMPAIKAEALAVIDPQLRDIPTKLILDDMLTNSAPVIQRGLAAVLTETAKVGLQSRSSHVTLLVRDLDGPLRLPMHMLGVTDKMSKGLEFFPMHEVLFASHCAYLPYLHAPDTPLEVETLGDGIRTLPVPVAHYELPDTKSFKLPTLASIGMMSTSLLKNSHEMQKHNQVMGYMSNLFSFGTQYCNFKSSTISSFQLDYIRPKHLQ